MAIAKWKNAPTVEDLVADYTAAKSDSDAHISDVERWLDALNITGQAKVITPDGRSQVQPKLVRKLNEWRYPALSEPFMSTDDLFKVSPVTYEDREAAIQNGLVLNHQMSNRIGKQRFIDEYIRTGVDEGTVVTKVSWEFEEEEVEVPKWEYKATDDPQQTQRMMQLAQLQQQDPERFKAELPEELIQAVEYSIQFGVTMVPVQTGTEKVMRTVKNQPCWEVCTYSDLVIDPTCQGDLRKAQFIIHSFETSLSELMKDPRYENLENIEAPDPATDLTASSSSFRFKDEARKKLVLHEYWGYWDIKGDNKTVPIVAAWIGDTLVRLEENPFEDGFLPFVSVQMLPVRKSNYGQPDAELIEDNQKVVGAVTRGMIDILARSANGQIGYAKGALDITNRRRMKNGDDYEFNPTISPDAAFHMHKFPELPQSSGVMLQQQIADAESLVGVRPFSQSQTGSIGAETAAGVKTANDATSKRDTAILRRFSDGIIELARITLAMNQQFLDEAEVVRITNEKFVPVRKDDLAGKFDLRINISTAEEDQAKAQELAFMLQTMGNNMDPSMSKIILSDIARLRKMPDLAKRIEEFEPQPDPMVQQKMQLEIELLQAQIAEVKGQAIQHQASAILDQAKAGTEQAKTRQTHSAADRADQDFVDLANGRKHAQDLEKISEQSKAQAETKRVEHELKKEEKMLDQLYGELFKGA